MNPEPAQAIQHSTIPQQRTANDSRSRADILATQTSAAKTTTIKHNEPVSYQPKQALTAAQAPSAVQQNIGTFYADNDDEIFEGAFEQAESQTKHAYDDSEALNDATRALEEEISAQKNEDTHLVAATPNTSAAADDDNDILQAAKQSTNQGAKSSVFAQSVAKCIGPR